MSDVNEERLVPRARAWRQGKAGQLIWRIGSIVLLLCAGGALALGAERLFAGGGDNETRVSTFEDWRVTCPPVTAETPDCVLTIDVVGDTGTGLLNLSLGTPAAGSQLNVTVPHGVALEAGMGFSIATEPMRLRPYETCTDRGCMALVTVDPDTLQSLFTNIEMGGQITIAVPGNTVPVTIPFSLRGFAEGYADFQRRQAQRTSFFSFLSL